MVALSSPLSVSAVPRIRARPGNESETSVGSRQNPGSRDHTCQLYDGSGHHVEVAWANLILESGVQLGLQWLASPAVFLGWVGSRVYRLCVEWNGDRAHLEPSSSRPGVTWYQ